MGGHGRFEGYVRLFGLCSCLTLGLGGPVAGGSGGEDGPGYEPVPMVRIRHGFTANAVRRSVEGAKRRLAEPGCQKVVSDFEDLSGRPLQASLEAVAPEADAYLGGLFFYDGSSLAPCANRNVLAVTAPGSRVIHICPEQFRRKYRQTPLHTEITIIHEMLHSLGLGEDPPTPSQITSQVMSRCRW